VFVLGAIGALNPDIHNHEQCDHCREEYVQSRSQIRCASRHLDAFAPGLQLLTASRGDLPDSLVATGTTLPKFLIALFHHRLNKITGPKFTGTLPK
jgi:hypothetical protein